MAASSSAGFSAHCAGGSATFMASEINSGSRAFLISLAALVLITLLFVINSTAWALARRWRLA